MKFQQLDGEQKNQLESNTGLEETRGEPIGENTDSLNFLLVLITIQELKLIVLLDIQPINKAEIVKKKSKLFNENKVDIYNFNL